MLSPEHLEYPMKPKSQKLLNDHILISSLKIFDVLFKCPDWDLSLGTVLVQSFGLNGRESFPSCPPSCVSWSSKRFRREENVSPRGRHPDSPACCSPPNVEGAGLIQSWQSYTCLVSTNFHFPADLGHLRLHRIPKELLHLCTTALREGLQ